MLLLSEYTPKSEEYFNYEKVSDILYNCEKMILVSKYFPDYGKHSEHSYLGPEPSFEEMHWKAVQKQKEEREWEKKEKEWEKKEKEQEEFMKRDNIHEKKEKKKYRSRNHKTKHISTTKDVSHLYKNIDFD